MKSRVVPTTGPDPETSPLSERICQPLVSALGPLSKSPGSRGHAGPPGRGCRGPCTLKVRRSHLREKERVLPGPPPRPHCTTGPAQSGILVDREVVSLFLHFTVNPKPRVEFIDRPRCCLRGKECSINRFQQVESRWGYSGTSDRIRWGSECRWGTLGMGWRTQG